MAQLTLANLTTQVQDHMPGKQSGEITRAANMALRRLYEVVGPTVRFTLTTVAPYSTGTVAITQGQTAVTLTTGTFAASTEGQLIQPDGETTWYGFTYGSASTGTLSSGFAGSTLTAGTYTLAYANYDLPVGISSVFNLWRSTNSRLERMNDEEWVRFMEGPQSPGEPRYYAIVKGTTSASSAVRVMLMPFPDAIYTYTGSARARPTLFTGSGTEYTGLPEDYDEAMLAGTLYFLWDQHDKQDRSQWWRAVWEDTLKTAKGKKNEAAEGRYGDARFDAGWRLWQDVP